MTPLHRRIANLVRRDGPISVERYMELCLADPDHGYYTTRDPFGAAGDFITAPEISQMFGEMIGVWIASAWLAMGAPAPVHVVELGPGRGALMSDALRAMRAAPGLIEAARAHLVEISPTLREKQRATLANAPATIAWHESLATIPRGPLIIVANEFFDALPIRQFLKRSDGWRERLVTCDDRDALGFTLSAAADASVTRDAADNTICETSPASQRIMVAIADRLADDPGAALIIDYGHGGDGFGDTLQAMKRHSFVDSLSNPGEADLTAHVDFAALARAARRPGVATQGPVSQAPFLRAMGIETRAQALSARATDRQKSDIATALHRLTDQSEPTAMGALFKAFALRSLALAPMPGFDQDTP